MASILVKDVSSESGGKLRLLFFLNYFRGLLKVATRQPSLLKGSVHMKCHQISKALFNSRFLYNSLRRSTPLGISDAGENLPKIPCRRESSKTIESWAQNSYFTTKLKVLRVDLWIPGQTTKYVALRQRNQLFQQQVGFIW